MILWLFEETEEKPWKYIWPWMEFCSLWCWHQPVVCLLTCNVHWLVKVLGILSKTELLRSSKPLNHLWAVLTGWDKDVGGSSSKGNKVAPGHQRFVGLGQGHLVGTKAGWVMRWDLVGFSVKLLLNDLGSTLFPIFTFTFALTTRQKYELSCGNTAM